MESRRENCGGESVKEYNIRKMKTDEVELLEEFLYQAIFQRDKESPIPRDVLEQPELRVFIDEFGQPDDHCLVVEMNGCVVGAIWARVLPVSAGAYGCVDDETPFLAISLLEQYRGKGTGSRLLNEMISLLREKGYSRVSLAVQKDNYALRMYEKAGFVTIDENNEEYIMVRQL